MINVHPLTVAHLRYTFQACRRLAFPLLLSSTDRCGPFPDRFSTPSKTQLKEHRRNTVGTPREHREMTSSPTPFLSFILYRGPDIPICMQQVHFMHSLPCWFDVLQH